MEFSHKVSIVIPVYNAQDYLDDCLGSLINQSMRHDDMEVILVDDGSVDNSAAICKRYCSQNSMFKYYYTENSGVSAARNFGIKHSNGKYIMYLDSDDMLTQNTVENIYTFFESVYDLVDLVTYFIQPYKDNVNLKPHSRYSDLLTHTGVYDLEENPYIVQTTMNICVKNRGLNNELFNEQMTSQEDQEYINRVLMQKLKIGYCAQACYMYNRNNESSVVALKFHAYYLFESAMAYFEDLFSKYEDEVPRYFQALFFHDLRWKLTSKILYPFHYDEAEFENAMNRIKALLKRVDVDIITKNPSINKSHIHYWLKLKPNVYPMPYVDGENIDVLADGKTISHLKRANVRLCKMNLLDDGKIRLRGIIELPIYDYTNEKPQLFAVENFVQTAKIETYQSSYSYVSTNIPTNNVYGFSYDIDLATTDCFSLRLAIGAYIYDVHMQFMGNAVFRHGDRRYAFARGNYILTFYNDGIYFDKKSKQEIFDFEKSQIEIFGQETYVYDLKHKAVEYRFDHRVWLYSDLGTVDKDNAYYQFIHDFDKADGIEKYYVYTKPYNEIEHLFTDEQKEYLIEFGSQQHQLLYLASEIIFTSFFGKDAISPFIMESEEYKYIDIEHFRVIYMQHGILHASYINKYSAEKANCDKVVVSSYFEIDNFTGKYLYKKDELIKCGMPRYSRINKNSTPQKKILFAPSWRSYFAANQTANTYAISIDSFVKSDYYKGFYAFLTDERLHKALVQNGIELDVKMHPIIRDVVSDLFKTDCPNIKIAANDVNLEDYSAFITDFSSFVFDFAYLNRPVMYFVPDYMQFKSGMNLYRNLDLPFEKAFGTLVKDSITACDEIIKIINNGFAAEKEYADRMASFYLPMNNCEEDIYNYVVNTMLSDYDN